MRRIAANVAVFGVVLGVLSAGVVWAASQSMALSPGDSVIISCSTSLSGQVAGKNAQLSCAAAPTPTATSTIAPRPTMVPTLAVPPTQLWTPALVTSWHWMIHHALDVTDAKDMGLTDPNGTPLGYPAPQMYDIDGFYNGQDPTCNIKDSSGACVQGQNDAVRQLHDLGKRVVCYIDTGVFESYRPDAYKFPSYVLGRVDAGWNGSRWLDIRRTDVLFPIMEARIKMCRDKGYDSIEPDEMVNYSNNSGFPLTYQDQLTYNRGIAQIAHKYGISIALKDDPEQAADLVNSFDWVLDEQCYQYTECDLLDPFTAASKTVFDAEYNVTNDDFCPDANARNFNAARFPLNLHGGRWPCR